jgi:hypothetical protein
MNTPETEINQAIALSDEVRAVRVVTPSDYTAAGLFLRSIKGKIKEIDTLRKSMTKPLDESKKNIMALFQPAELKLAEAVTVVSRAMITWENEQETKRREFERRAQAEAQKRAEEEALAMAIEVEATGDTELAEVIIAESVIAPPVKILSTVPKINGTFSRETWSAEVTDIKALAIAVAAGQAPVESLQANMTFLNQMARSFRDSLKYPGVRAVSSRSITSRQLCQQTQQGASGATAS